MDIEHGEFVVLVGPSGCGKSTMLRMICGLETITNGDLYINQKRVNDVAPADRDIAMVFQNYALYSHMTTYENMGFSLTVRHKDGDEIHQKVMEAAKMVELTDLLNRKPNNLSGGQRQRVALGRSIVRDSSVFLMDEPLSNLDAKLRTQTRKELVSLHKRLNATFIYVTHDQVEAMTMATRMVVMNNGYVQQIDIPWNVYEKPENKFVAGFIGSPSMNFVEGEINQGYFNSCSGSYRVSIADTSNEVKAYEGKKVIMGIRPEHFDVKGKDECKINCCVDLVEFLGSEYVIAFTVKSNNVYKATINASKITQKIGNEIDLYINMGKIHFFDPVSEQRI
jgi:multiple sugar transport system ATP-binding protein